jgi:hypothetical protein
MEETTSRNKGHIILNLKDLTLSHGTPTFDAPIERWQEFIERCQAACPLNSRGGLHKMFPGSIGSNQFPDDEDSDLNPPTRQQVRGFLLMERFAPIQWSSYDQMVWV